MLEDDGLPMRKSGEWIKAKHHYLKRYCDIVAKSMRSKYRAVTYLDVMAGPGRCRIRETNAITHGSPFVALECGFTAFRFYESDPESADALVQRVSIHPKAELCKVVQADWTQAIFDSDFRIPDGLSLAFIDPTGISQVPWFAVERLANLSPKIDIMMTIQHGMGISMNKHQYQKKESETAVDAFLGGNEWRTRLTMPDTDNFKRAVLDTFTEKMGQLGFQTRKWMLVRTDQQVGLYYICLFSRHPLALNFWDKVIAKDELGQRAMDL